MLSKKFGSMKKLAKIVKSTNNADPDPPPYKSLSKHCNDEGSTCTTPRGMLAVYVGQDRQRFVVPVGYLSHPLFKMLLDKAENEFGLEHRNGLVLPCSAAAFQEVRSAIECCNGRFEFGEMVEEFVPAYEHGSAVLW